MIISSMPLNSQRSYARQIGKPVASKNSQRIVATLPAHSLGDRGVHRGSGPRAEHHEGVVDPDAEEEEGRGHVEGDELHARVAAEAEAGEDGEGGGDEAAEADEGLGAHVVPGDGRGEGEGHHGRDVDDEGVGHREPGLFHLPGGRVGDEHADLEKGEGGQFPGFASGKWS